jgi:hypothetical protein
VIGDPSPIDFTAQSAYSDPRGFGELFDAVEPSIAEVSSISRNVIVHYRESEAELPNDSRDDINLRWLEAILATDQHRHPEALSTARSERGRVQGCCRDHSLLCVGILRRHGIPARTRVGFASYFLPGWHTDHVIVEAWMDGRWRRFDPEVAEPRDSIPEPDDIPIGVDSPFLTASQAWVGHRSGTLDVSSFGVFGIPGINGDWFVYDYVISEVAHRFGHELLLWDLWGAMTTDLSQVPEADLRLVDEVAALGVDADSGDNAAEERLRERFMEEDRLFPSGTVRSLSPIGGEWEIELGSRSMREIGKGWGALA